MILREGKIEKKGGRKKINTVLVLYFPSRKINYGISSEKEKKKNYKFIIYLFYETKTVTFLPANSMSVGNL